MDPTILFVGDLSERYGPDMLIKAMPASSRTTRRRGWSSWATARCTGRCASTPATCCWSTPCAWSGNVEGQALDELIQAADVIVVPSREADAVVADPGRLGRPAGRWWPPTTPRPGLLEHEQDSVLFYPSENSCVWGIERVLFDAELGRTIGRNGPRQAGGALRLEQRGRAGRRTDGRQAVAVRDARGTRQLV